MGLSFVDSHDARWSNRLRFSVFVLALSILACEREVTPRGDLPLAPPADAPNPTPAPKPSPTPTPEPAPGTQAETPLAPEDLRWADELQHELAAENRESLSACPRIKDYKACKGASHKTIVRHGEHLVVVEETVASPENPYQPAETSVASVIYSKRPLLQRVAELSGRSWMASDKVVAARSGFGCDPLESGDAIKVVSLKKNRAFAVDAPDGAEAIAIMGGEPVEIEVNTPSTAITCDATMKPVTARTYVLKCGPKQCNLTAAKTKRAEVQACVLKVTCDADPPDVEASATALGLPELVTREALDVWVARTNSESLAACDGVTEARKCKGAWKWTIKENATHLLLRGELTVVAGKATEGYNMLFRKRHALTAVAERDGNVVKLEDDWLMIIDGPEWVCGGPLKSVALFDQRADRIVIEKKDFDGVRYSIDNTTIQVYYEEPGEPVEGCVDSIKSFSRTFKVACSRSNSDAACTVEKTAESEPVAGCHEQCD